MSDFEPVRPLADLDSLDDDQIVAGYREWTPDAPEPGPNRGRAYWHGWRNASIDHHTIPTDDASWQLVREYRLSQRELAKRKIA